MLRNFLEQNNIQALYNESLKKHTSFKVGGNALCIASPDSEEKASELIKFLKENDMKYYFLGNGSNVIFNDNGFDGVIIKTNLLNSISIEGNIITCGSGVTLTNMSRTAAQNGLSGLECCYGIPGNIGGGTFMNAGAYGGEVSECIEAVTYIDENGEIKTISKEECDFSYRHSVFVGKKWLITKVRFNMKNGNKEGMLNFMDDIMQRRRDKQPLDKPSAGSSFKRPEGYFAAALIDECGLKGFRVGGAQVSEKHAGFIVNAGDATCEDIVNLANKVRQIVYDKKGVTLEKEMIIV